MGTRGPETTRMNPRMSQLAGTWYSDDRDRLSREVESLLGRAPPIGLSTPAAILVPHAGYAYSGPTAACAYRELAAHPFDRIIVIGPSHRLAMQDMALVIPGGRFRTPLGTLMDDQATVDHLCRSPGFTMPKADRFDGEHSVEMQFPFLQTVLPDHPVTAVVTGRLSDRAVVLLAAGLRPLLSRGTLLVISSDFTHYGTSFGYTPFDCDIENRLRALDLAAFSRIEQKDRCAFASYLADTGATLCGADTIGLLLELLQAHQSVQRLDYRTSGHVTGDWAHCVSYLAAAVVGAWKREDTQP